jgi:type I restriction enzyme, R subunit
VFFKRVRSKTKFWQMLGRGTRLCRDLFGPGLDKEYFQVFDYCENFEFFNQHLQVTEGAAAASVSERRFVARLDLLQLLQVSDEEPDVRAGLGEELRHEVGSMNTVNFVVRPHRRLVEKFREPEAWTSVDVEDVTALAHSVASLPTELPAEPEEAKRFDVLLLHLQLAFLRSEPGYTRLKDQVKSIAGLLEEYPSIPAVAKQLAFIADVQSDEWWEGVTLSMLESLRTRLRLLVQYIEKRKRKIVYTDFADEAGEHVEIEFEGLAPASNFERFRKKARVFLREHKGESAVAKVHQNWPITTDDIAELERILIDSGIGTAADCDQARTTAGSFGLFIRSLIGLDRAAAKNAFNDFLDDKTYSASQIEFVNLVIDDLSQHGVIDARRFYESPFTDVSPQGPEGLFSSTEIDRLVLVLDEVRSNAAVA